MKLVEPMLASKADRTLLVSYCEDDVFGGQQKIDGDRLLIHVEDGKVQPTSRNHSVVAGVTRSILNGFARLPGRWVLDGEYFAGEYFVFDLLVAGGTSLIDLPLTERYEWLQKLFADWDAPKDVRLLTLETEYEAKCELAMFILENNCEGLVFKRLDGLYLPGARDEGTWHKIKFRHEVDCVVMDLGIDGKQNMAVGVYRDGVLTPIGEVTARAGDGWRVKKGDVVRVIYQYMTIRAQKLYQPTKPILRTDKTPEQCLWDQLVWESLAVRS